jgi:hypothetical protein
MGKKTHPKFHKSPFSLMNLISKNKIIMWKLSGKLDKILHYLLELKYTMT